MFSFCRCVDLGGEFLLCFCLKCEKGGGKTCLLFDDLCFQYLGWNFWYDSGFVAPASQTSKIEAYSYGFSPVSGDNKVTGHIQDLSSFFPTLLVFFRIFRP